MHLLLGQSLIHLLDSHEFFDLHDLTGHVLVDGVEDCGHAFLEAEGVEDVSCAARETDCRADEGDAEVGHFATVVVVIS